MTERTSSFARRLRGLAGIALSWGGIGAALGAGVFLFLFRPWAQSSFDVTRLIIRFAAWESLSLFWGMVSGMVFGIIILALERSRGFHQLSARRMTLWGALAGAALPAILTMRPLLSGMNTPYFLSIIGASAVAGALWARATFRMARRAPEHIASPHLLTESLSAEVEQSAMQRDRVQ